LTSSGATGKSGDTRLCDRLTSGELSRAFAAAEIASGAVAKALTNSVSVSDSDPEPESESESESAIVLFARRPAF
jgi:hypothetical protein